MKKYVFILLLVVLQGCALTSEWDDGSLYKRGILWKISKPGQQPSYVLGTLHSDDPSVTRIPDQIEKVFNQSSSFVMEAEINGKAGAQAQKHILLPGAQTLDQIVGKQRYQNSVLLMSAYGFPEMMVAKMKPWAVANQLGMPRPVSGVFLDLKLYQMAHQQGKRISGLMTAQEQLDIFEMYENMSIKQQVLLLDKAIENHAQMPDKHRTLIHYYLARDLRGLKQLSDEDMLQYGAGLSELLQRKMFDEHIPVMVERMQPQLEAGNAFIAVGILYLPGKAGILNQLAQRGYAVTAVY